MNICVFDDFIQKKFTLSSNIVISSDVTNVSFSKHIEPIKVGNANNIFSNYDGILNYKSASISNINIIENNTQVLFQSTSNSISADSYTTFNSVYVDTSIITLKSINDGSYITIFTDTNIFIQNNSLSYDYTLIGKNGITVDYSSYPNITISSGNTSTNLQSIFYTYQSTTLIEMTQTDPVNFLIPNTYTSINSGNFTRINNTTLRYLGTGGKFRIIIALSSTHFDNTIQNDIFPVTSYTSIPPLTFTGIERKIRTKNGGSSTLCSTIYSYMDFLDIQNVYLFCLNGTNGTIDIERMSMNIVVDF